MAAQGQNDGFHVLDDFVCEAIQGPSIPRANPATPGQNEGSAVAEELVVDLGNPPPTQTSA